jgi:hypothetical protein
MMQAAIDQKVDMVAVRYLLVSAAWPVLMVALRRHAPVGIGSADRYYVLGNFVALHVMEVPIMKVVDMVLMAHSNVSAIGTMHVVMIGMYFSHSCRSRLLG